MNRQVWMQCLEVELLEKGRHAGFRSGFLRAFSKNIEDIIQTWAGVASNMLIASLNMAFSAGKQ